MVGQTLWEARKYEEAMESGIRKEERPAFHLCPRVGWMNDPNGFSYYRDSTIYFINITLMIRSGGRCIGDMR